MWIPNHYDSMIFTTSTRLWPQERWGNRKEMWEKKLWSAVCLSQGKDIWNKSLAP